MVGDAGGAATEPLFVGRHIGEYQGCPPTGRDVRVPLPMFFGVEFGRISAIRIYYSLERLLTQLGEP